PGQVDRGIGRVEQFDEVVLERGAAIATAAENLVNDEGGSVGRSLRDRGNKDECAGAECGRRRRRYRAANVLCPVGHRWLLKMGESEDNPPSQCTVAWRYRRGYGVANGR